MKEYGIKKNVATMRDGDVFGELALIDVNQHLAHTSKENQQQIVMRRRRAADCITIENSWLLKVKQKIMQELT